MQETGGSLILYPEGTRSRNGQMQAFKSGAVLFAFELEVPVVPAYIEGTNLILPKGCYVPRAGRVMVRFGEPIEFDPPRAGELPRERRRRAVERLTESIRRLSSRSGSNESSAELQKETASQIHG